MNHSVLRVFGIVACVVAALGSTPGAAVVATIPDNLTAIPPKPLFLIGQVPPLVMLDISKDQQLYKKAYNDYSDLNNDGALETTYQNSIDYYGYFDPRKCYSYSSANMRFEPAAVTADKYCAASGSQSTQWSGNFLNWAAMARMDAVRKLLYGGMRSETRTNGDGNGIVDGDTATSTVLERTFLPNDAHSWAKYYDGPDLGRLTPYTPAATVSTTSASTITITNTGTNTVSYSFTVTSTTGFVSGDYVNASVTANPVTANPNVYLKGQITAVSGSVITVSVANGNYAGSGTYSAWTLDNLYAPVASTTSTSSKTVSASSATYEFTVLSTSGFASGDYVNVFVTANPNVFLRGKISSINTSDKKIKVYVDTTNGANYGGGGTTASAWTLDRWTMDPRSTRGITLCNTTKGGSSPQDKSQTNTNLPRLRIAKGNFALWSANERWQCQWDGDQSDTTPQGNSNHFLISGIPAAPDNPSLTTFGTGTGLGDYFVRIQVCVPGLIGTERCKQYGSSLKPIGLLQVYGDSDQIYFGLMTGSYDRNISGGVLRKNIGSFTDEINVSTNGTFTSLNGIVGTLDRLRIYGYDYSDGTYLDSSGDNCNFGLTSIVEGACTSWGNPMAEVFYESLRYFTTGAATPAFNYTNNTSSHDYQLGLPVASWPVAPPGTPARAVTQANYCAPLNTLVFNASVSTTDIDLKDTTMGDINCSGTTAATLANLVGTGEGIPNNSYFVGANGTNNNELCDAKVVGNLGSIWGICPEGPTQLGSYLMPGLAYRTHTHPIRTDLSVPTTDKRSLKVATYGIQLATNVPRIPITLTDKASPRVILQPAFRLDSTSSNSSPKTAGGGTLVEMRVLAGVASATTASGTLYVNWEDSEQGGDYDQDLWGIVKYCLTTVANGCPGQAANTVTITTDTVAQSTPYLAGFGYVISGTTKDGAHFHSGINGFNFTDAAAVLGCASCQGGAGATSVVYPLGSATAQSLQDPVYYAAKWGGFNDINGDGTLTSTQQWDVLRADGTPGSDGIPDNYFFVSNPTGLETALNAAFLKILSNASAAAVATNSASLNTGSRIYLARFNSYFWSGQLLSFRLDRTTGAIVSAALPPTGWDPSLQPYPEWDAGQKIKTQADVSTDTRVILTRTVEAATGVTARTGVNFAYANLSPSQKTALDTNPQPSLDNCGLERLAYLRGQSVNEGAGTFTCATSPANTITKFRTRSVSILGDIVNSQPVYVGPPAAGYADAEQPGYPAFAALYAARKPIVYVGANDGMLHGFDVSFDTGTNTPTATSGAEVLGYVPSGVYGNLSLLTTSTYQATHKYFVDASGMMADACVSAISNNCNNVGLAQWKTLLIGGLGAGGKGYYALDVTNPTNFAAANASSLVLWEFTNDNDADLGLTYNLAPNDLFSGQSRQIAKFNNGRWGVIVGNGYISTSGKAVLYVLFLRGPTGTGNTWQAAGVDYVKIEADAGPYNGLSTPVPIDTNGDGKVDVAYAGDLQGNVWRFNLSSTTASSWTKTKLFAAGTTQPFTVPPEVSLHPVSGVMVFIGSGRYLDVADNTTAFPTQTYYGIQDVGDGATVLKSALSPITVSRFTDPTSGRNFRTAVGGCGGASQPACPISSKGWYLDLLTPGVAGMQGERTTGLASLIRGIIFFNTFIPSTALCDYGGTGYLIGVNYLTGTSLASKLFDTNGDGVINADDALTVGTEVGAALGGTTMILGSTPGGTGVGVSSLTTGQVVSTKINVGGAAAGRLNWREILR